MATNSGVRVERDTLSGALGFYKANLQIAAANAEAAAYEAGKRVIGDTILSAVTVTGQRRAGEGRGVAGRVESGAMLRSAMKPGGERSGWTSRGNFRTYFRFADNNDAPRYTALQEAGYGNIPAMLAFHKGWIVYRREFLQRLAIEIGQAGETAEALKLLKRAEVPGKTPANLDGLDGLEKLYRGGR